MKKLLAALLVTTFSWSANATVINFDAIDNTSGNAFGGNSLDIDGFNFSNSGQNNGAILHWFQGSSYNADPDGTTYSHNYGRTITTLTQIGGAAFTINSLDIGNVYNSSPYSQTFRFTADVFGGGSLSRDFVSDALSGLETVNFNWDNIVSFTFTETTGTYLQADNFVLDADVDDSNDIPEPATLGLFGIALLAMRRLRRS